MQIEPKIMKFLLRAIALILITGCATIESKSGSTILVKGGKICIDQQFGEFTYRECATQSLVERDIPLGTIKSLLIAEQKRRIKHLRSTYNLGNGKTKKLSRKWNRTVSDMATIFSPTVRTDINPSVLFLSSDDMLKMKESNPDLFDFFLRTLFESYESAPQPVFREKRGQIILENDPTFKLFPLILEKVIEYLKVNGKLDEIEEKEIREQFDKEFLEPFMSVYIKIAKYLYPIQYDHLVMVLAIKELHELYASINKKVFIILDPSFEGARSDHVGNLLLSQAFLQNLDDNSLETIMAHEAGHLLIDNTNPIILCLLRKFSERWNQNIQNIKSIVEEISGEHFDHDMSQELDSRMKQLKDPDLWLNFFELSVDMVVLKYFNTQPLMREKYANVIATFEKVPKDRVAVIDAVNVCIDSGERNFQAYFAIEEGEFRDKSPISPMSECSIRLKVALKEYFERTTKQIATRILTKDADLFLQSIADEFTKR